MPNTRSMQFLRSELTLTLQVNFVDFYSVKHTHTHAHRSNIHLIFTPFSFWPTGHHHHQQQQQQQQQQQHWINYNACTVTCLLFVIQPTKALL